MSYDARKYGKRTNEISPNPQLALKYDWELIRFIKKNTTLPVIVKGILTVEDTKSAIKRADAIWISNHGGRMFNSGISSIEALIELKKRLNQRNLK